MIKINEIKLRYKNKDNNNNNNNQAASDILPALKCGASGYERP